MGDAEYERDREICLNKMCILNPSERNILSHGLYALTSLGVVVLTVFKITHPLVTIGAGTLYGLSHFLRKHDDTKMKKNLKEIEKQLENERETNRRLSSIISNESGSKGSVPEQFEQE